MLNKDHFISPVLISDESSPLPPKTQDNSHPRNNRDKHSAFAGQGEAADRVDSDLAQAATSPVSVSPILCHSRLLSAEHFGSVTIRTVVVENPVTVRLAAERIIHITDSKHNKLKLICTELASKSTDQQRSVK